MRSPVLPNPASPHPAPYAELVTTSAFTFLTGASHPEELVGRAASLGLQAIAITDRNTLAGVVRAHAALRDLQREQKKQRQDGFDDLPALPRLIIGCRLALTDSVADWIALPTDRTAYGRLCRLLSLGKRRAEKGECLLTRADVEDWAEGLILLACPPDPQHGPLDTFADEISSWNKRFPSSVFLTLSPVYDGQDTDRFVTLSALAQSLAVPLVAAGNVLMHHAARRRIADILTCIRERLTVEQLGHRALPNAERRLKSPAEMATLFAAFPEALEQTIRIAERCRFSLDDLRYDYPDEVRDGEAAQDRLCRLAADGLAWRYPDGVPAAIQDLANRELAIIGTLGYAPYFLTVHDIVHFARQRNILCQGRGSAANSVVCFALGVTSIGPETISMVFERFVSEARDEPPDIDVDFEHQRREEVIQHIYEKYGRDHAGLCATVIHFRARAALREVGLAMGLSGDVVTALSSQVWGWSGHGLDDDRLREVGLDPRDPRLRLTMEIVDELIGFPRHLSQHVGGFVITRGRLDELCPIENAAMEDRTIIEWDKTDIDTLGIMKVDILSLGMLTCLRKAFDLLSQHYGQTYTLATLPQEDIATYDMLCKGDSLGVFQVESRAQMNFLPRLRPRTFYDLVIEVAIVRPGPIQGDMVHPYLRRRRGEEPVHFPSRALQDVLGKTLGVPLFQEQAMRIAIVGAGFSAEEADRLRRSLAAFRRTGSVNVFHDRFVSGMRDNGYPAEFAERCFSQIEGFGEYGFPESHAASFALLAYASAWLKRHYPAVFACALLNSQPMGFYAPAQIVRDAREHGVEIRPIDINTSYWDCSLEQDGRGSLAIRLGFRQIKGLSEDDAAWITSARGNGYPDVESVWRRAGVSSQTLSKLAEADAFAAMDTDRRKALWDAKAIKGSRPLPLFSSLWGGDLGDEPAVTLPPLSREEQVVEDYMSLRLSLRAHPVALLRPRLPPGIVSADQLPAIRDGKRSRVCGLVITRQRPGTASGVIFLTLEDETGVINVVVWRQVYEAHRRAVISGRLLDVQGRLQQDSGVIHLIADQIIDASPLLETLGVAEDAETVPHARPTPRARHPRDQAKVLFPSRDFH